MAGGIGEKENPAGKWEKPVTGQVIVRPGRPELEACGERGKQKGLRQGGEPVCRRVRAFGEAGIPILGNAKTRMIIKRTENAGTYMRKEQKMQAERFLSVLAEAHAEIKKQLQKNETDNVLELLQQCQQGAIWLGSLIEETEGENFITVRYLEDYCEAVYQIYEKLERKQAEDAWRVYKLLHRQRLKIENSIQRDIQLRREIVFLPYKASMWDSMESVWKAADEDPDCDAYVIPIPYYDRNPDGGVRKLHYEIDRYPENVPVIRYETYEFEKRRPDMIIIHNPYDNKNFVTSVPPFFYSENLKQYTECLVYIPYFILGEVAPDDEQGVKEIEHFCTVPGVLHADRVIVQSERMRQVYIKVLTEYAGKDTKKYWENKILGLGSPKIDQVLRTRFEELEIPGEWRPLLVKPDGSWKKVVLYNTSVGALLRHGQKTLEKIQSVFRFFYENQEEAVLLWRPHPLIQATMESMRPQLWEDYREIVEMYKEQGWGIYDDSAKLDRAVGLADAYYGDPSSLVELCRSVGMPVMIQDADSI